MQYRINYPLQQATATEIMSENTYQMTEADVQKAESRTSKVHGGDVPAGSEAAMMQSIVDKNTRDKQDIIAERQSNLPLPEDPPGKSDFNSSDQRTVNVGSGEEPTGNFAHGAESLREPVSIDASGQWCG